MAPDAWLRLSAAPLLVARLAAYLAHGNAAQPAFASAAAALTPPPNDALSEVAMRVFACHVAKCTVLPSGDRRVAVEALRAADLAAFRAFVAYAVSPEPEQARVVRRVGVESPVLFALLAQPGRLDALRHSLQVCGAVLHCVARHHGGGELLFEGPPSAVAADDALLAVALAYELEQLRARHMRRRVVALDAALVAPSRLLSHPALALALPAPLAAQLTLTVCRTTASAFAPPPDAPDDLPAVCAALELACVRGVGAATLTDALHDTAGAAVDDATAWPREARVRLPNGTAVVLTRRAAAREAALILVEGLAAAVDSLVDALHAGAPATACALPLPDPSPAFAAVLERALARLGGGEDGLAFRASAPARLIISAPNRAALERGRRAALAAIDDLRPSCAPQLSVSIAQFRLRRKLSEKVRPAQIGCGAPHSR